MGTVVAFKTGPDRVDDVPAVVAIEDLAISATQFAASIDLFRARLLGQSCLIERRNMITAWDYMFQTLCKPLDVDVNVRA